MMAGRDQRYIVSRQSPRYSHDWFFEYTPPRPMPKWGTREEPEYMFVITVGADLERAAAEQRLRTDRLRLCPA